MVGISISKKRVVKILVFSTIMIIILLSSQVFVLTNAGIIISEIKIMRFPEGRKIAILYSPDDIFACSKITDLDILIKILHPKYPQLQMCLQTVPYNLLISDYSKQNIETIDENWTNVINGRTLWRLLQQNENYSYIELGNHGYYHKPPFGQDLDHEFDSTIDPETLNYTYCLNRLQKARDAYQNIGLDNSKILLMRFPGFDYTIPALMAIKDLDYLAFYGLNSNYKEEWIQLPTRKWILNIPSIPLIHFNKNQNFTIDVLIQNQVDIFNFFNHYWEFKDPKNFNIFCQILDDLQKKYTEQQIWWCKGSDLAKKLNIYNLMKVTSKFRQIHLEFNEWSNIFENMNYSLQISVNTLRNIKFTCENQNISYHLVNSNIFQKTYWIEVGSALKVVLEINYE